MSDDINQSLAFFIEQLQAMELSTAIVLVTLFVLGWFSPTILAVFFNRKNLRPIFLANIPAVISWVAWGGMLVWAIKGKSKGKSKKADKK